MSDFKTKMHKIRFRLGLCPDTARGVYNAISSCVFKVLGRGHVGVLLTLQKHVLEAYHDQRCHIGADKIYQTLRHKFYWPNLYSDVYLRTRSCLAFQKGGN